MNLTKLYRLKKFVAPVFVFLFLFLSLSIAYNEVKTNKDIRIRASGKISGQVFCDNKEMCGDGRCVGETWRECSPCPSGSARSVYRISCDKDVYSTCTLDDKICND